MVVESGDVRAVARDGRGITATPGSGAKDRVRVWGCVGDSLLATIEEVGGVRWCGEAAVVPPRPWATGGQWAGVESDDVGPSEEELRGGGG
jgi:hypothetical protein